MFGFVDTSDTEMRCSVVCVRSERLSVLLVEMVLKWRLLFVTDYRVKYFEIQILVLAVKIKLISKLNIINSKFGTDIFNNSVGYQTFEMIYPRPAI